MFTKIEYTGIPTGGLCFSLGRNGSINTSAILVSELLSTVVLQPVRKNGNIGRCQIELPKDKKTIKKLAKELNKLANSL